MSLHFAYGSNMSRALMCMRCPGATPLGTATLRDWRFVVTTDGVGSIARGPGAVVHGVLWRLRPGGLAAINAYESVDSGLYVRRVLSVRCSGRLAPALIYIARWRGAGRPRPGFITGGGGSPPPAISGWWAKRRANGTFRMFTFAHFSVGRHQAGAVRARRMSVNSDERRAVYPSCRHSRPGAACGISRLDRIHGHRART